VDLQDKQMQTALANIEKMEDVFFSTVGKAAQGAGSQLQGPWEQVLKGMKLSGTDTGAQATETVEQLVAQARTTLREGRATSMRAAQAMMDSYAALVSGVLIGMSEGLTQGVSDAPSAGRARRK